MKQIVFPGDFVSDKKDNYEGVFLRDEKLYSKYLGVVYESNDGIRVVPMNGKYILKDNDLIIGKVVREDGAVYLVDINSVSLIPIFKRGLETELDLGDLVLIKVVSSLDKNGVNIVKKLSLGELIEIDAKKVPRVIGKNRAMQNIIEEFCKVRLTIGSNGFIYVYGDVRLASLIIEKIMKYSHVDGLTNKIQDMIDRGVDFNEI